jgi:hypothetical protein
MGVVVAAEQGQVVEVGAAAVDPVENVVPVAPGGRVGAAGEGAAGVPGNEGHGLSFGGEPLGSAECERDAVWLNDGGPDLSLIGDPQQLIRGELRAVGDFG